MTRNRAERWPTKNGGRVLQVIVNEHATALSKIKLLEARLRTSDALATAGAAAAEAALAKLRKVEAENRKLLTEVEQLKAGLPAIRTSNVVEIKGETFYSVAYFVRGIGHARRYAKCEAEREISDAFDTIYRRGFSDGRIFESRQRPALKRRRRDAWMDWKSTLSLELGDVMQ